MISGQIDAHGAEGMASIETSCRPIGIEMKVSLNSKEFWNPYPRSILELILY